MNTDKKLIKNITPKIKKYYIGKTAMRIVEILRDNSISEHTRSIMMQEGYTNAYNAIAYQRNFGHGDSYTAIMDDMWLAANMQFTLLPEFVHQLLQREPDKEEEHKRAFCSSAFKKALALIGSDIATANDEAAKRAYYAELPF